MIVDRHRVIAEDELHVGVLSRDDLAHAPDPDCAVHHADALHLVHQLVLRELGILSLQPVQPLRRTDFLDIEELEKRLEVLVPFAHVGARKCVHHLGAPAVDITEQVSLDLVVDRPSEEGRIQILVTERSRGRRIVPCAVLSDHAPVRKDLAFRRHVYIGKRRAAGFEEPLLVPLRYVVIVSCLGHRRSRNTTNRSHRRRSGTKPISLLRFIDPLMPFAQAADTRRPLCVNRVDLTMSARVLLML